MRENRWKVVAGSAVTLLFLLFAGFGDEMRPFVGYDYVRHVPPNLPANRSPYEDLANNSVYDSQPPDLDVFPEPEGEAGQAYPFSHFFSKTEPNLGSPPDILGPEQFNLQ